MNEILFTEQQKFKQWWLWLIILTLDGSFIIGIYKQLYLKQPFGDKPMSDMGLLIAFGGILLLTLLFYSFKLQTIIKKDGIYVRFFPLQIPYRKYSWDKLDKIFVREYSPIMEYGGWGLRFGLFGRGMALNVSGDIGLQLVTTKNSKLLIGTQKPDELIETLSKIGQYRP